VSDARADIIGLSEYAYQRTRSRLAGLTDDEYFWSGLRIVTVIHGQTGRPADLGRPHRP